MEVLSSPPEKDHQRSVGMRRSNFTGVLSVVIYGCVAAFAGRSHPVIAGVAAALGVLRLYLLVRGWRR
jgi:hypothetical protein